MRLPIFCSADISLAAGFQLGPVVISGPTCGATVLETMLVAVVLVALVVFWCCFFWWWLCWYGSISFSCRFQPHSQLEVSPQHRGKSRTFGAFLSPTSPFFAETKPDFSLMGSTAR